MIPAYMPFTHIPESTARLLFALVGPLVIYQPLKSNIHPGLSELATQGIVEIRTPIVRDDDRLRAALTEFTEWARLNPGKTTAGAGFFGSRQGEVPFFDETSITRIRSDLKNYAASDSQADESEAGFSARLFLALAQDNDLAVHHLDNDLDRFNALEKNFLETLKDAGDAAFKRQAYGTALWREDPGAKLTGQRIRAWASLAAADDQLPQLLITTSLAVIETLIETHGEGSGLDKLADIRLPLPSDDAVPVLGKVLAELATGETPLPADLSAFALPAIEPASETCVSASLYAAANLTPASFIGRLVPAAAAPAQPSEPPTSARHTLIVLLEG